MGKLSIEPKQQHKCQSSSRLNFFILPTIYLLNLALCGNARVDLQHTRVAVMSFDSHVHAHVFLRSSPARSYLDSSGIALANHIYYTIR